MTTKGRNKNLPPVVEMSGIECELCNYMIADLLGLIDQTARQGDQYYRELMDPERRIRLDDEQAARIRDRCNSFIALHNIALDELEARIKQHHHAKEQQKERQQQTT